MLLPLGWDVDPLQGFPPSTLKHFVWFLLEVVGADYAAEWREKL